MVPRNKVSIIKKSASFETIVSLIREVAHSRYPVVNEDIDGTVGFFDIADNGVSMFSKGLNSGFDLFH